MDMNRLAETGSSVKLRIERIGLVAGMAVATINIWTGAPLLAVWVGARVQGGAGTTKMSTILVVALVLGAVSLVLIRVLAALDDLYGRVSGRKARVQRHLPWLRSMRGERPHEHSTDKRLSPLELLLVISVVLCVVLFEVWFFFFSSSPIDGRSGRS
jgi:hypothetical protein